MSMGTSPAVGARRGAGVALLGLAWVAVGTIGAARAAPDPRTDPDALRAALVAALAEEGAPGAAWALVSTTGVERVEAWGRAGFDPPRPMTPDTLFRVGSISKTFVALAFARLAERSAVGLDTPLRELLPGLAVDNPWEAEAPVRLSDLLEHTSGLPDYHFPEIFRHDGREDAPLAAVVGAHPAWLRTRWKPGTRQGYSNRAFAVAALALEAKTGLDYEAAIAREVFDPLGIRDARYRPGPAEKARLAEGVIDATGRAAPYLPVFFQPAGNLVISVPELARLTAVLLARGKAGEARFLRTLTLVRLEHPANTLAARAGLTVGTGLGLGARCEGAMVWLGHYGGGYAYKVDFRYSKETGRGYVLAINSSFHGRAFARAQKLLRAYRTPPPAPPPAGTPIPPDEAARLAGWYVYENPRHQPLEAWERLAGLAAVSIAGDRLVLDTWWKGRIEAVRVGPRAYARPDDACTGIFLVEDEDGEPALVGDGIHLARTGPARAAWRGLLVGAAGVALTGPVQGGIGLVLGLAGRGGGGGGLGAFPTVLALLVLIPLGIGLSLQPHELGLDSAKARAVWAFSGAYGLAPWVALVAAGRSAAGRALRGYVALVALAHGILVVAFAQAGWIGLRLWAD